MIKKMTIRTLVRIISFVLAVILILGISTASGYSLANRYRTDLEYTYMRALNEFSDYVSNMETTLTKGIYANTAPQQYGIAAKLLSESSGAKSSLGELPLGDIQLNNINKFLSQVGDFASYLSSNLNKGKTISEEDMKILERLGDYARSINADIKSVNAMFDNEKLKMGKSYDGIKNLSMTSQNKDESKGIGSGFREMNEGFTDYPTLVYDGPFSDHITQIKPKFLQDKGNMSMDQAKEKAAKFLDLPISAISFKGESQGNMPVYNFSVQDMDITVTKAGGYVNYLLKSRQIGDKKLDFNQAAEIARDYLAKHDIGNMKESYYVIQNNICTINYAYQNNSVVYYSDLVKISVALDNGEVVGLNNTGYLMNHTIRPNSARSVSIENARNSVSKNLTIERENIACVPTKGLSEVLCYEFECTGQNGDKVLVYIDCSTGLEEQILVLLMSDSGILTL